MKNSTLGKYVKISNSEQLNDFLRHADAEFSVSFGFDGVHGLQQWIESNINEIYVAVMGKGRLTAFNSVSHIDKWES